MKNSLHWLEILSKTFFANVMEVVFLFVQLCQKFHPENQT